ncbi:MAG: HPr family phosphocarrier protein [Defluviitaleaceae bacterium]|nr:HPr family phosphocarrier protein [Defluviitaleaceae bacterium]
MIQKIFTINASLDARDIALFVQAASKYNCRIELSADNKTINAKSFMGLISLGNLDGQNVTLLIGGADEEQAVAELYNFLTVV